MDFWGVGWFFTLFCRQFPENLSSDEAFLPLVVICGCWRPFFFFTEKPWVVYISGDRWSQSRDPVTDSHGWEVTILAVWVWSTRNSGGRTMGSEWERFWVSRALGVEPSKGIMRWPHCSRGGGSIASSTMRRKLQFNKFEGFSRRHLSCDCVNHCYCSGYIQVSVSFSSSSLLHRSPTCLFPSLRN